MPNKTFINRKLSVATYYLLFTIFFTACLDQVKVPLRQETEKLIVEGLLTNETNPFLRLSLTTQFGSTSNIEPLKGAYVELRTGAVESIIFRPAPSEVGLYRPQSQSFSGKIGSSYSLYIKLPDGREYKSEPQKLPTPVPIETLTTQFTDKAPYGFQTYLDVKDPADENYYRWAGFGYHQRRSKGVPIGFGTAVCCDRCWVLVESKSVNIFSDALSNGSLVKQKPVFFSPFFALGRHLIEVQQYTISRQAYQYWSRYRDQQQRTGSIFDPLPAPLLGNIVNVADPQDIALGYFEVSAIARKRTEPVADTQGNIANIYSTAYYIPDGDCMLKFPYAFYTTLNPPGW